jgi:tripartite-type tricarboxylate transporter receptor subunit TctC
MSSTASRRNFAAAALTLALGIPFASHAQQPVDKPLRMVVIVAPGGSADFFARMLAEKLQASLKRTVIVENKPGAGGNLATSLVAASDADGTTLLFTSNNHTINPHIYKQPGYSPERDFMPVAQVSRGPAVLVVHPSLPVTNLKEYIEYSRKTQMFYATYGGGSAAHLAGELLKTTANLTIQHVPYKGAGPALNEVLSGQVPSAIL